MKAAVFAEYGPGVLQIEDVEGLFPSTPKPISISGEIARR